MQQGMQQGGSQPAYHSDSLAQARLITQHASRAVQQHRRRLSEQLSGGSVCPKQPARCVARRGIAVARRLVQLQALESADRGMLQWA